MTSLSRVQLLATLWTAAHQAPPSMGFARQEHTHLSPGKAGPRRCPPGPGGETFPAIRLAGSVLDLQAVAAPEGGALVR